MALFEIDDKDAMGRTGRLEVGDKEVRTPALMPVLNPHLESPELGEAQIVITNSYIIHGSDDYRDAALDDGLHETLGFDGVVVTDSGSYQMSVYGEDEIEVSNREILEFQDSIGTDVATPLDVPTPPDASYEDAESDLETTLGRVEEAAELGVDAALNAPVQGAVHGELRERSAREVYSLGLDVYPVGGVVPLMQEYRYGDLVDVVAAAKRGLGADVPVHLFGAGHPMVFALAVAVGCDLFDSAAYALYADEGRYLTSEGTRDAEALGELPCACGVCSSHTADEVADSFGLLSQHNLNVSFSEMRRVREAVRHGNLLELVEQRCRAHPKLLDGLRRLGDHAEMLERYDPASKSSFFYLGNADRPEVVRHHERLDRIEVGDEAVVTTGKARGRDVLLVNPPFGPFPPELAHTYPLNAETPDEDDHDAMTSALGGVLRLVELNPETEFVFEHTGWDHALVDELADEGVELRRLDE